MARGRATHRFARDSDGVEASIIEAVQKVGPKNVSKLSRMVGAHPETVRYKLKRRFTKLGFHIQAEADYRKLGLVPHWAEIRLAPRLAGTPKPLFLAMSEHAYLVYYGHVLPQGSFACLFALPAGHASAHRAFLSHLEETGAIEGYTLNEVTSSGRPAMNPRFFDFQSNRWEVDWDRVKVSPPSELKEGDKVRPEDVDYEDLLLVKELQLDASQHLSSIAKKVGVHQKTLEYHFRVHVQREKLISGYPVRWQHEVEKSASQSTLAARLVFKDLGGSLAKVQRACSRIPFIWSEDLQADGTYVVTMHIPVQETNSTFDYLGSQVPELNDRVQLSFMRKSETGTFTVPYQLFGKQWKYDIEEMKGRFRSFG